MCLNHCFPRYLLLLWYGVTKQFTGADAVQFHTCWWWQPPRGRRLAALGGMMQRHRSSAVLPGCTCLAGGSSEDVEIQGRECLKAEGGGERGREGRRRRVQGRTSRLKSQAQRCSSILPAISYTQKPPPLLAALAGWGSRMWVPASRCRCSPALAGAPKYLLQGGAARSWISYCQLLGGWSKKQGDWIYGNFFIFARGV